MHDGVGYDTVLVKVATEDSIFSFAVMAPNKSCNSVSPKNGMSY